MENPLEKSLESFKWWKYSPSIHITMHNMKDHMEKALTHNQENMENKNLLNFLDKMIVLDQTDSMHSRAEECYNQLKMRESEYIGTQMEKKYWEAMSLFLFHTGQFKVIWDGDIQKSKQYFLEAYETAKKGSDIWWLAYMEGTCHYLNGDVQWVKWAIKNAWSNAQLLRWFTSGLKKRGAPDYEEDYIRFVIWKLSFRSLDTEIIMMKRLQWGQTNLVYVLELKWGKKVVLKLWENLTREAEFFWFISEHHVPQFPKLLEVSKWGKALLLEFKKGINGKEIVDHISESNWKTLWNELWESLQKLHTTKKVMNNSDKAQSIKSMIDYLSVESKIFDQNKYDQELKKLEKLLSQSDIPFVMLHGDFSPHNCLFEKNGNDEYSLSTILDPSGRVAYGVNFFDVVYIFNTRWNKNKDQFMRWFLEKYPIDMYHPLFLQFEKVMRMYLTEIYSVMGDVKSAENIMKKIYR